MRNDINSRGYQSKRKGDRKFSAKRKQSNAVKDEKEKLKKGKLDYRE